MPYKLSPNKANFIMGLALIKKVYPGISLKTLRIWGDIFFWGSVLGIALSVFISPTFLSGLILSTPFICIATVGFVLFKIDAGRGGN